VICPHCGAGGDAAAERCPTCGAARDADALVPVQRTADAALLPLLKSLLDSAGIPYVVQGEEALGLFPLGPLAVGLVNPDTLGASILVPRARAEEARALLRAEFEPPDGEDGDDEPEPGP
jgi:hypothetical protein